MCARAHTHQYSVDVMMFAEFSAHVIVMTLWRGKSSLKTSSRSADSKEETLPRNDSSVRGGINFAVISEICN